MLYQSLLEALDSLTANKLRSSLTILGIVIGVAAVLAMVSIGRGAQNPITSSIQGSGSNLIFVMRNNASDVKNPKSLTLADATALADSQPAPDVATVSAVIQGGLKVTVGSQVETVQIMGISSNYALIRNLAMADGDFISDSQVQSRSLVAVIGPDTAATFFGSTTGVVGKSIRILGTPFKVIGVLQSKGGSSAGSSDDVVLVPIKTAQARLFKRSTIGAVDTINVSAVSAKVVTQGQQEITDILHNRHRIGSGTDDFRTYTQQDLVSTMTSATNVLTIFLGGIAGISLLVGGIGVMNIMLVSVTERTHEIGLRKALGARRTDISLQFLTEAAMLSLIGGIIGIIFGWAISLGIARIAAAFNTKISPSFGLDIILAATLFSAGVGIFFGLYPANRAAGLEPVEALRYQ